VLKSLVFLLVCAVIGGLISSLPVFDSFDEHWIDTRIRQNGVLGVGYFLLFSTGAMAIGCPRQVMAFLGGYAFGFLQGTLLSVSGAICGCMVSFFVARFLLKPVVRRRYASRIHSINRFVEDSPVTKTIIIRLLPLGSNFLTNLMAGVTNVKARHFILGSGIGYIPQMALFALMGKGIVVMSIWKVALSVVMLGICVGLSILLYKKYKHALEETSPCKPSKTTDLSTL
tara:strand:+ start:102841 stop:103524 length:684 start_codon:yes stop_codon:yes gene_type:complete